MSRRKLVASAPDLRLSHADLTKLERLAEAEIAEINRIGIEELNRLIPPSRRTRNVASPNY